MPTLSDKLRSMGVKVGARDLPSPPPRANTIDHVVPGRLHPTQNGEAYVVESFYPLDHAFGNVPLRPATQLHTVADWAGDPRICACKTSAFAYLDIETTGLSGGTGTYAFLVGVGRFEADGFRLAQFFMRDPTEEPAQLLAIEEFIAPCETLVTYNGKSFDAPLLTTRYITQGWKSPLTGLYHIDLLHLARRLWRDRMPSRTLGNVETYILGARRTAEDVPGWLVPQLYFDYLRSGDARSLKSVFYHNEIDVVAMAALLYHVSQLLTEPVNTITDQPTELVGMARLLEDLGRVDEATQLYRRSLEGGLPEELFWNVLERLSFIYKRQGDYPAAIRLWEQAASHKHIYAHVELAKYYEHQKRDGDAAREWTQAALHLVQAPDFPPYLRHTLQIELQHRLERLQRKSSS